MLKIQRFVFSPFSENTYIIWNDESLQGAIIDPGCYDDKEREAVDNFILRNSIQLQYLINTHCHIDHIFGNAYIKSKYKPIFLAPEKDIFLLDLMIDAARNYGVNFTPSPPPDKLIVENSSISLGDITGEFIFTPGHTPGEFCLYFKNEKVCFTGDVLFKGSIGRTDLWGGDAGTLFESIQNKLLTLPDEVVIYPGHESRSTIGEERIYNPFLK
ncbi:MAG: MBL fold hydrolase [Ignavibacteriae bacterium HGW-Ignavibacteriae-3]|nr:MAG: MBL fold hydrolase [Ignavibacteriae bacterium HGW-Ignavibacteriae-3]